MTPQTIEQQIDDLITYANVLDQSYLRAKLETLQQTINNLNNATL